MTIKLHKMNRELDNMRTMIECYGAEIQHDWYYNYEDCMDDIRGENGQNVINELFED